MALVTGGVAPGIVALLGLPSRNGVMLGTAPPYRVSSFRQVMIYVLYGAILGLHGGSLLVELDFPLFIFLSLYVFLGLWDKIFLNASFITAHKISSFWLNAAILYGLFP
jgi:hypothetical protein